MAIKEDTQKAKDMQPKSSAAAPGIDPKAREAAFSDEGTEGWDETGSKFLFKPEHFVVSTVDGVSRCWREGPDGKKIYTAPVIKGFPYDVQQHDDDTYGKEDGWQQVAIRLTKSTIVKIGEGDKLTEQLVEAGQTVLVKVNTALERVRDIALLKDKQIEVTLRALQKEPIKGGKQMWRYSVKENPVAVYRATLQLPKSDATSFDTKELSS